MSVAATGLDGKLADVARQYDDLQSELARPEVVSDPGAIRRLGQELARLEPVVAAFRRLEATRSELRGARELRDQSGGDDELRHMASEEIERLSVEEGRLLDELKVLLLPRDPNDDRNVILEIRAGAGGEEAALFAQELLRMYVRYADRHRLRAEAINLNETGIGGLKEAIVEIDGHGAYSRLKFEGGVHRVQRVPTTESAGRIHTSTATVAVLPEAEEIEVQIDEKDLRVDVYRSTGPGGQSVNTTDSAVRITHLPTGIVVAIQDEKSQLKNRARAMQVLRARLLDLEQRKAHEKEAEARRSMVGTGERSEKIRTYNFPQDRLTDHRLGRDFHGLPTILNGNLDDIVGALVTSDQATRLAAAVEGETAAGRARAAAIAR
jgi:peptide chain release factor 1